ncbi:MAG: succinate-semialdehyde dehydrogenase/glutarate-semialdehyde dehydrogenase, partial [Shewanella psychromarinicola]|uniref:aldehyde dehydrogenase family protein n=1 Tax=Shewanella psychromarinicola TaxID=2487742 RepID=UPI003EEBB4A8
MELNDPSLLRQQCYINGQWRNADNGQTIAIANPATHDVIGHVPVMGSAETLAAIDAAQAALPAWRALTAKDRGQKLRRWFELIHQHSDDLALLMTT